MARLDAPEYAPFEALKHIDEFGTEFWLARDLSKALEYDTWRRFQDALNRAMLACDHSKMSVKDHFVEVVKMVELGSGSKRSIKDYRLSRYACYLVVQNGDPRKNVIALGNLLPFSHHANRSEDAA
ncbi:BRO family protein [Eggerthella lenta]|jgi:DNA-damage-inducible protein D|uniref:BRO family protein n=1 Tax=Eggerthella lenta TaxID=84112 RepID=UPI001C6A6750|nr:BRO family protein [Eggerthella lenta]MDB1806167.1 hypothetical protein [Eggerthella lenta]